MHPAHAEVEASRKRRQQMVDGRARGGALDRPGRVAGGGLIGGASEAKDSQSTSKPLEERETLGIPLLNPGRK